MKVKIARIDSGLPLPMYATQGSVGFDFLARETIIIPPHAIGRVPANVIVEVPQGYMLIVASRSSTPVKKHLSTPHGIGIIDHDYCGSDDEIKIQVYNFSDADTVVQRGEKIAQGVFIRIEKFELEEIEVIARSSRGGFGSTDGNRK